MVTYKNRLSNPCIQVSCRCHNPLRGDTRQAADEFFNVLSILQQFHIQKKDLYYLDVPFPRFKFHEAVKEEQSLVREVNGCRESVGSGVHEDKGTLTWYLDSECCRYNDKLVTCLDLKVRT